MVDKKGNFNFADFSLDKAYDMIDDKMAKNLARNLQAELGPNALQKHKPVISGPGGIPVASSKPISSGRAVMHQGAVNRS